ncbi:hypothetical protein FIBSPDRAFT_475879 [Athelia psychrophila]|uniref:Uncharacterized protein n=1 Tax=Athelia psychrophila TaxID=1759441 RepID=A0A166L7D7_9AGAM|nr:hypothetical protein FIBSPDRAFT_475879 [Fibularhizoctonia sp. CBS 109695]
MPRTLQHLLHAWALSPPPYRAPGPTARLCDPSRSTSTLMCPQTMDLDGPNDHNISQGTPSRGIAPAPFAPSPPLIAPPSHLPAPTRSQNA